MSSCVIFFFFPPTDDFGDRNDDTDATPTGDMGLLGSGGGDIEKLVSRGMSHHSSVDTELKDSLQPLPRERLSIRSRKNKLITTHSDDNDSAVSMVSSHPEPIKHAVYMCLNTTYNVPSVHAHTVHMCKHHSHTQCECA